MDALLPDLDDAAVAEEARVADMNIVTLRAQDIGGGGLADGDVVTPGGVGSQRLVTEGRVAGPGGVESQRLVAEGCVTARGAVAL